MRYSDEIYEYSKQIIKEVEQTHSEAFPQTDQINLIKKYRTKLGIASEFKEKSKTINHLLN